MGGDFNLILKEGRDRWPKRQDKSSHHSLREFLTAMGQSDIWRTHNPNAMQYTFHSRAHSSLSRIDYLLTQTHQLQHYSDARHLARGISDHSPIWATLCSQHKCSQGTIKTNPWYLKIPMVRQGLVETTEHYFTENEGSVDSELTLWEAYK